MSPGLGLCRYHRRGSWPVFLMKAQGTLFGQPWLERRDGLFLLRLLVGQGTPDLPRSSALRLFITSWLLFGIVITVGYTSNLTALLTSPAYQPRIHNLFQLTESDLRIAILDTGNILHTKLKNSQDTLVKKIKDKMDLVPDTEGMVTLLQGGTHGMIAGDRFGQSLLYHVFQVHNWYMVEEGLFPSYAVWYFPQHTPWRASFSRGIRHLQAAGMLQYWQKEEMHTRGGSAMESSRPFLPLSLHHLQGAFFFIVLGWITGGIVLLLEMLCHQCSVTGLV
ncbi:ionotropic receptor 40a-like [Portunus trituberculatus]|uniref:ionotropic receptor 40a-like n=1 Tax=Portunus trituberculatus TaxID=210409 RepID=UPI001E1CD88D|nr:ionotropic receptor 40a-like [Portunus trituberculatus]